MLGRWSIYALALSVGISTLLTGSNATEAASGGLTWYESGTAANDLYDVAVNERGIYVAVGDEGMILTSTDAKAWTSTYSKPLESFESVATNGDTFVVPGMGGTLLTSSDGMKWVQGRTNRTFTIGDFYSAAERQKHDKDYAIDWKSPIKLEDAHYGSAIWDGKQYVAVGNWAKESGARKKGSKAYEPTDYLSGGIVLTSKDGTSWEMKPSEAWAGKLVYGGNKYVLMMGRTIGVSTDLTHWKEDFPEPIRKKERSAFEFTDITYANGLFYAIGWDAGISNLTGVLMTSADGIHWKETINRNGIAANDKTVKGNGFGRWMMNEIFWDGKQFWISGFKGLMLRSDDGESWEKWSEWYDDSYQPFDDDDASGSRANMNSMIFDGARYVIVGNRGTIIVSEHLTSAEVVRQINPPDYRYLSYDGKNRYVASGDVGTISESSDGFQWKTTELRGDRYIQWEGIASANGVGIVVATEQTGVAFWQRGNAYYYYSAKQGEWEKKSFPVKISIVESVMSSNGLIYVFGKDGYITSKDGINWSPVYKAEPTLLTLATNKKTYVGISAPYVDQQSVAQSGHELYASKDGVKWSKVGNVTIGGKPRAMVADDVLWSGSQYVAVGARAWFKEKDSWLSVAAFSKDGVTWRAQQADHPLQALAWNGKQYVAANEDGTYVSGDGVHYKALSKLSASPIAAVIWDGRKFIAAGKSGALLVSEKPPQAPAEALQASQQYWLKYDKNEDPVYQEQLRQQEAYEAFVAEAKIQIERIAPIGTKYEYYVYDERQEDGWMISLNNTESLFYKLFIVGERRNQIEFYVYFNGIDNKQIEAASDIISMQSSISKEEAKQWIQRTIDGRSPVEGTTQVGGVSFKYALTVEGEYGKLTIAY